MIFVDVRIVISSSVGIVEFLSQQSTYSCSSELCIDPKSFVCIPLLPTMSSMKGVLGAIGGVIVIGKAVDTIIKILLRDDEEEPPAKKQKNEQPTPSWGKKKRGCEVIRFPWDEAMRRREHIEAYGQPVVLRPTFLGKLFALAVIPQEGFVHLCTNPNECERDHGVYHISICQIGILTYEEVNHIYDLYDGMYLQLPVSKVRNAGYLELDMPAFPYSNTILELHNRAGSWYKTWDMHVSA